MASYRALYTADLHISNSLSYSKRGATTATDRLEDTLNVLCEMAEYASQNMIGDVWVLGDLLDKRLLDAATITRAVATLRVIADELPVHIHITPGNHEASDSQGSIYTVEGLIGIRDNITVYPEGGWLAMKGTWRPDFLALPYKPDDVTRTALAEYQIHDRPNAVLLMHQSIVGGKVKQWICPDGILPVECAGFGLVLCGHFHTPHTVEGNIHYLGAPMQHHFGDANEERGFWDITMHEDGTSDRVMIPTSAPKFVTLPWEQKYIEAPALMRLACGSGDYTQFDLTGNPMEIEQARSYINHYKQSRDDARLIRLNANAIPQRDKKRTAHTKAGEQFHWKNVVGAYLDSCNLEAYSRQVLEQIAQNAIEEAEQKR